MSRLTIAAAVSVVMIAAPAARAAGPQECRDGVSFASPACSTKPAAVWSVRFGQARLPTPLPVMRPTHHGLTTVAAPSSAETSQQPGSPGGWFVNGLKLIPMAGPPVAIDCPMQKPAPAGHDKAMVHQVQGHVRHSAVVVPVAPCRK